MKRRWLIPEVIQTSAMDCGPASLKALLEGFGVHASYGRLREACHTEVDGTSIDTLEEIAIRMGLQAEQTMQPVEDLVLPEANALPCLAVTRVEGGGNHFTIVWRKHGPWLQIMDPAAGRRWVRAAKFLEEVYVHEQRVPAEAWLEWASGPGLTEPLRARMRRAGVARERGEELLAQAPAGGDWRAWAGLDAAVHLAATLRSPALVELANRPELIPEDFWRVRDAGNGEVFFKGAVILRCRGVTAPDLAALSESLRESLTERPPSAWRELLGIVRSGGSGWLVAALLAALVSSGAVLAEALLFRSLFSLAPHLTRLGDRLGAAAILVAFLGCLLALEWASEELLRASGRNIELRLRLRFCLKIPRLGDRYFQSRLISDMAQRAHAAQLLRGVPPLAANLLQSLGAIAATVAGIAWFFPAAALPAFLCAGIAIAVPLLAQPLLLERDLRFRELAGSLNRFYLDALLGIVPIRTHGAGPALRRSQGVQLARWAQAGLRMQRSVVLLGAVQSAISYALAAWLVFAAMRGAGGSTAALLLLVYWALSLPELGQSVSSAAWQWPSLRNSLLRLLEPLTAPSEIVVEELLPAVAAGRLGVKIEMRDLEVSAGGRPILQNVNLTVEPGEHVGIVGMSGAGKSSLVGLLLGWHRPARGTIAVDGKELDAAHLHRLRRETAWVDPQVQLWNETLLENLRFGLAPDEPPETGRAIDEANLGDVIQALPNGLQSPLGEGGALLSGGEGQRVRMARAYGRPGVRLAILDEPARGLDRGMRDEFIARARATWQDATLLCITHDVASTRAFSRVLVIEAGGILEDGDPAALYAQPGSRYRALCDLEEKVRDTLWNGAAWRRVKIDGGRLREEETPA